MKIYTKTGDDGSTGLLGSQRVSKHALRIDAYGTVDELNASIGLIRATNIDTESDAFLAQVQNDLFSVGAALADPSPTGQFHRSIRDTHIIRIEQAIDVIEAALPPLTQFILPGGTPAAAQTHQARTVCRRAERLVVGLAQNADEAVAPELIVYLNRLSDALFVLARALNHRAGVTDIPWSGL